MRCMSLMILIILSGCEYSLKPTLDTGIYDPCIEANLVIEGMCVKSYQRTIHPEMVDKVLDNVQMAFWAHGYQIDMHRFVTQYNIGIVMVPTGQGKVYFGDPDITGTQYNNLITLADNKTRYSILAHELIHAVGQYEIGVSYFSNVDHNYPNMFVENAVKNNEPVEITVEFLALSETSIDWSDYQKLHGYEFWEPKFMP